MLQQKKLFYGGDYNPEQWSKVIILEDMRLMKKANVNYVSLNIFGWASIQPTEEGFDFSFLDEMLDLLWENGIGIDLANGTASPPAWLVKKHPEILPVTSQGTPLVHGSRQHYCPSNEVYRSYVIRLTEEVAKRYATHPGIVMWHVNNEYTCHISECYCESCEKSFRQWLQMKYKKINILNECWSTKFWSQSYSQWDEIFLPKEMPTFKNPAHQLDYKRFISDQNLTLFKAEKKAIRSYSKDIPVMTNLMGLHKHVDGFAFAEEMDVVGWDSYPNPFEEKPYPQFLANDLTRSLKKKPFLVMEQAPSAVNWRRANGAKSPGQMRLWSYEALAHGADGILFFQWRQSQGGAEKFHSGMVSHNQDTNSRIFKEVVQLGTEMSRLDELVGTNYNAEVAIVFDWENWWALELDAKPSWEIKYIQQMRDLYIIFHELNIGVDFIHPKEDLSNYKLVLSIAQYLVTEDFSAKVKRYIKAGGHFLTTFFSGIVDEYDRVYLGGYPGAFKEVLGIYVEEFDPMPIGRKSQIKYGETYYTTELWEEVIHLQGAETIATFTEGYLMEQPALTKFGYGKGTTYYMGTKLAKDGNMKFIQTILAESKIQPLNQVEIESENSKISMTCRSNSSYDYIFLLNYGQTPEKVKLKKGGKSLLDGSMVEGEVSVKANDVKIIKLTK